jgi:hypothetical protein
MKIKIILIDDARGLETIRLEGKVEYLPETGIGQRFHGEICDRIIRQAQHEPVTIVTTSEMIELRLRHRVAQTHYGVQEDQDLLILPGQLEYLYLTLQGQLEKVVLSEDGLNFLQYPDGFEANFTADLHEAGQMARLRLYKRQ